MCVFCGGGGGVGGWGSIYICFSLVAIKIYIW